ncbi:hypothetical protein PPYR_05274 [Photinus pyralis]|uniref:OCEL domain-containing protein n=1 Tax=Photinus pyralis TaxID=7054 RepID=A0A5N4AUM5_PHOPY|nr:RNA polymerase II elongation factor Ell [Photinus pyralis]KAB0800920.1 hypothetical protein PPYR_05274 [Photinus pyralis]
MAALCPGVKYGLSSQENFGGNKDLIFVKLTDSALRAIEDYIKNQNKFSASQNPTIKFLGNEGQLSFPSFQNGITSFNFSMSTTADMEGPGGSFECIQQLSPPRGSLETLGVVPYKIRIHANDDIYEATRHRMTVAEENHKNKCTREIKPNQTDIGRKVKVKQIIGKTVTPPSRRDAPQQRENGPKMYQSNMSSKPVQPTNGMTNGFGNSLNNSRTQNKPSMPDIARRPIRERLLHLLALRPFKKPELYERLVKEGLREKNSMTSILKQISFLKDNAFHLNRAMWNDVREDWPFYTESERQMLKRRKPQNLTPPGSSDGGSSGSGQSPTSTHPGSPPPPISSSKRPGYYDGVDGLPTKRPRISHYRKPSESIYRSPAENISQRRPVTDSRDASNMNPRSREPTTNGYSNSSYSNEILNEKHSDEEDVANRKRSCDSHSLSFNVNREKTYNDSNTSYSPYKDDIVGKDDLQDNTRLVNNDSFNNERIRRSDLFNGDQNKSVNTLNNTRIKDNQLDINRRNNNVSSRPKHSPNSEMDKISLSETGPPNESAVDSEFPDYLTEYATIRNGEQRRRYKSDFNADYAEYRELHAVVEKVSRRFAELEERLKQENIASPKYKDIKKQIFREYKQNKQDIMHQKAKGRFQYLHDKLSHIKRLVLEYDQRIADDRY